MSRIGVPINYLANVLEIITYLGYNQKAEGE